MSRLSHAQSYDSEVQGDFVASETKTDKEQYNRTQKRISELLASEEEDLSSDSEEDQDNSPEVNCDSLSAVRRDLYLGLLCLLLLILLLAIWLRSVCLKLEPFLH